MVYASFSQCSFAWCFLLVNGVDVDVEVEGEEGEDEEELYELASLHNGEISEVSSEAEGGQAEEQSDMSLGYQQTNSSLIIHQCTGQWLYSSKIELNWTDMGIYFWLFWLVFFFQIAYFG